MNFLAEKKTYDQIISSLDILYSNLKKTELSQDYILKVFNELESIKKDIMLLYYIDLPINYISYTSAAGNSHLLLNRGERENMVNIMFSKYSRCKKYITTSLRGNSLWNMVRHKLPKDLGKDLKEYLSYGESMIFYDKEVKRYYQNRIITLIETEKDDILSTYSFINEVLIFIPAIQERNISYYDFETLLKEKVGNNVGIREVLYDIYYRITNNIKWKDLDRKLFDRIKYMYYSMASDDKFRFVYPTEYDNISSEAFDLNKNIYEFFCSEL